MITPVARRQIYENVCTQMINLIEEGKWKEGERIPGEVSLAQMFNVSRNSLRTAVKVLHSSEILISKPGIGTFVSEEAIKKINNNRIISMIQDERYAKEVFEVRKILDRCHIPSDFGVVGCAAIGYSARASVAPKRIQGRSLIVR